QNTRLDKDFGAVFIRFSKDQAKSSVCGLVKLISSLFKRMTMPRLELMGDVIGTKTRNRVLSVLK
ncbi:hypothetical protein CEXT_453341, partial [Caerostris extrusa]